ncbi:transposase [Jatrophihabitans sp. DSM 45814]
MAGRTGRLPLPALTFESRHRRSASQSDEVLFWVEASAGRGHRHARRRHHRRSRADRRPRCQTETQLTAHPDAAVFTSLPRSGTVRAARILAEIGDARGVTPPPEALTRLAGAAPSTRRSGKVKIVAFRWAVDRQLRGAVIDFAGNSHHANPLAADLYAKARALGHDHPAPSATSPAWLNVIWRRWQDGTP